MTIGHTIIGSGTQGVIVLHGWFGDYTVFNPMLPYLDTDSFRYAFVDYRGYGKSRDLAGEHTMKEIAGDAIALADELGWDKFHVIGHSMGGMAVQRVAVDATARVLSGVAITPVPAAGVPFDEQGWGLFSGAADDDGNRRMILDITTGNRLSGHWLDWMVRASRATTTRDAFADYLVAWAKTNFLEEANGLATPLLVLPGEHDPALGEPVMRQTFMQWYPNATLHVLRNAGHYPMQETPVHLATVIEAFMREHGGGQAAS
ncbi:MAG: alpha/beta hydrolase [Myxococcales bacterium]|nr:alpha/beta hydrolase [Myxococcales bacterium]MCB9754198.1 alpha/beta hydrolase [Myxococcales bacterium]